MLKEQGSAAVSFQVPASTPKTHTQQRPRRIIKGLPAGEKILYLSSVVVCILLAVLVMSRFAEITQLEVSIQQTEKQMDKEKEVNLQLESEKLQAGSLEQIRQFAKENGLQVIPSIKP